MIAILHSDPIWHRSVFERVGIANFLQFIKPTFSQMYIQVMIFWEFRITAFASIEPNKTSAIIKMYAARSI